MPALAIEKQAEHLNFLRLLMVSRPDITLRQAQDAFLKGRGHKIDLDYLTKLRRKILAEREHRYFNPKLDAEVAKIEDTFNAISKEMWKIVFSSASTNQEKARAAETILKAHDRLLQAKMDAGIFERQLGKLKVVPGLSDEQSAILARAIDYGFQRKIEGADKKPELPSGAG